MIEVAAGDSGPLAEMHVKLGDAVTEGDLLAELDSGVIQASRQTAAARAESTARIDAAIIQHQLKQERYQALADLSNEGHGNPEELKRAEAEERTVALEVQAAKEETEINRLQLAEIEARLEQRRIRSRADGVVTEIVKEVGEFVSLSEPHVMTIVQLHRLRATFYLSTAIAMQLKTGDVFTLSLPEQNRRADATIEHVSSITNADSGRVRVDLLIDNAENDLRSGVRCNWEIDQ